MYKSNLMSANVLPTASLDVTTAQNFRHNIIMIKSSFNIIMIIIIISLWLNNIIMIKSSFS